jgi:uncharacterized membrane protein
MSSGRRKRTARPVATADAERSAKTALVIGSLVAVAVALAVALLVRPHFHTAPVPARPVEPSGGAVEIQLSDVAGAAANFYETQLGCGKTARFFVTSTGDGVHAAVDACAPCGGGMGHHQHGRHLVCTKCGKKFGVATFHTSADACRPLPLSAVNDGGRLRISVAELERVVAHRPR